MQITNDIGLGRSDNTGVSRANRFNNITGYMPQPVKAKFDKTLEDIEAEYNKEQYENGKLSMSVSDLLAMMERAKSKQVNGMSETDWRDMTAEQWDRLVKNLDDYINDYKEEIEQMIKRQQEAATKAALNAAPEHRAMAASHAALLVIANGHTELGDIDVDAYTDPKDSWTYNLETDDLEILEKAKMANELAECSISKMQELLLTDDVDEGISAIDGVVETASSSVKNENEKVWTITAFSQDGIICKQGTKGNMETIWELKYDQPGDYRKVWRYLAQIKEGESFEFASHKDFWEEFLKKR